MKNDQEKDKNAIDKHHSYRVTGKSHQSMLAEEKQDICGTSKHSPNIAAYYKGKVGLCS